MAENSTSDDFKSFVNEFAAEAKFFGRASLPTEFTGKEADLRSSVSMETTQYNYSPCTSERNSFDFDIQTPKSVHEFTYTVSSQASSKTPTPPPKPARILYGPCPGRRFHSNEVCEICHLTDQEYRIERLEQSRHVYGKLSKEYAKKSSLSERSTSLNAKKQPPPSTSMKFGTTILNGRKDRRSTSAYPPLTFHRPLTTTASRLLQQQRHSSLAMPSTISSSKRTSMTSTLMAPTMSSSRKSVTSKSMTPTVAAKTKRPSLTPVLPSTSRLLAPTISSGRKSLASNMETRKSLAPSLPSRIL
uniref:Uncharacterized protein n=1 Tax=Panagrolaimus sp. PS1159 TaxID=55785 RepID=A0AC35F2S0_9BILA